MKRYLLSDGRLSINELDYIIDTFVTRLKLLDKEIPWSENNGIRKTYTGIEMSAYLDFIQESITSLASSIDKRLKVTKITVNKDRFLVLVNINQENYELSIRN